MYKASPMITIMKGLLHKSQLLGEEGCFVLNPAGKHLHQQWYQE